MKTKHELIKAFEETLNETLGIISIGPYKCAVSDVLKAVDPTAYKEELLTWADYQYNEGNITQEERDLL